MSGNKLGFVVRLDGVFEKLCYGVAVVNSSPLRSRRLAGKTGGWKLHPLVYEAILFTLIAVTQR